MANFVQVFCCQNFLFTKAKMDEFNYLQFLNDDSELLEAEEVLLGEFPTFSVQFDEYFDNFPPHPVRMRAIPSPGTKREIQSQLRKYKM